MDLYKAIKDRRSVRRYKSDAIPQETLDKILEAATWAPSWAHSQCAEVIVVDDPALKLKVREAMPEGNPAYKAVEQAPVLVAFLGKKKRSGYKKGEQSSQLGDGWLMFDVGLVTQNFMLAAHAEGLATVCIGLFDNAKAGEVLGVPEELEVVCLSPLGVPNQEPNIPPRKTLEEFAHKNGY